MDASVIITATPCTHDWSLFIKPENGKIRNFYLGQDSKFCRRVLGMETSDVVAAIKTKVIAEGTEGNKKLAQFIIDTLELTEENIENIESWQLCCQ
jgi:hypothetical protein